MKRLAISLSVCLALVGWAATGHAKRGGGRRRRHRPRTIALVARAARRRHRQRAPQEKEGAPASESLDTTGDEQVAKVEEEITGPKAQRPTTTLSWQDIVVVPRKAFLKGGRLEIAPIAGITVNDNLIRHYMFALDFNYFLTDALWVGLQGQYFVKQLTTQADLVGLQFNRLSTMNRYLYGGALNFGLRARVREVRLVQQVDPPLGDLGVGRRRRDVDRGDRPRPGRTGQGVQEHRADARTSASAAASS